ncbi:EamA-like transporter family protein [Spironucleus salmonicida]|uniref:EamA-like transporter family protein n=1 Tax=Spironucleus salmonicida TaxID=348837 RepID=V6LVZ6_9EUKA|nr:EamA-like transporter family protein [Spironucleus salmonicida]|eukprot:EST48735.1 Transmembrane domain-containing protein [Spironucleus salmonicida]
MVDKESGKYSKKALFGILGMLIFGTGTMISSKLMLDSSACPQYNAERYPGVLPWTHGNCPQYLVKKFEKPWFQTAAMFSAMTFCIFGHFGVIFYNEKKAQKLAAQRALEQLEEAEEQEQAPQVVKHSWKSYTYIGVPAIFDMVATTIMTLGLVYIDVSIMQMLRGSLVIFASFFSVWFLKRKIKIYQWCSVILTTLALCLVGVSCVLSSQNSVGSSPSEQMYGCFLIVISQLIQATQIVCEDFLLSGIQAAPLQIVGMEGVWGLVATCAICWPIVNFIPGHDNGVQEDIVDTFYMLADNGQIASFTVIYWFSILVLNWAGMVLTAETSSVVRSIFESIRTIAIWLTDLLIFYVFAPHSVYGEAWTTYSWLQLAGFVLLIFSSQCYNGYVKFPFFKYADIVQDKEEAEPLIEGEHSTNLSNE